MYLWQAQVLDLLETLQQKYETSSSSFLHDMAVVNDCAIASRHVRRPQYWKSAAREQVLGQPMPRAYETPAPLRFHSGAD